MKRWLGKSMLLLALLGIIATLSASVVFAQEEGPQSPRQERGGRQIIGRLAEETGLSPEEMRAELEAGKTLAEIATENDVDPEAFVADILAEMQARLEEAVADGNIEQERAEQLLANAAERLPEAMNQPVNLGQRGPGNGQRGGHQIVGRLAEETGLSPEEMRAELEAGKTLAEIATENGVDPEAFVTDILAEMQTKLEEAVANGNIEEERADQLLANAAERLPEVMNQPINVNRGAGNGQQRPPKHKMGFMRAAFGALIEATGLTPPELFAELQAGKTPAEVIVENGGSPDAVVEEILTTIETKLDEAVADGKLEQERADEILETATEHVTQWIDQTFNLRFPGPGRGRAPGQQGQPPVLQGTSI